MIEMQNKIWVFLTMSSSQTGTACTFDINLLPWPLVIVSLTRFRNWSLKELILFSIKTIPRGKAETKTKVIF